MKSDLIIVGAGIIGLFSAFLLARRGLKITLVDKGDFGRESSWAAGGILTTLLPWDYDCQINQFTSNAIPAYQYLSELLLRETAIDIEFCKSGLVVKAAKNFQKAQQWCTKNRPALSASINAKNHDITLPDIYQLRPPRLLCALTKYLNQTGVRFLPHTEVVNLQIENSRVTAIHTSRGIMRCSHLLWATGAWACRLKHLQARLDLPAVTPVRGQMIALRGENIHLKTILFHDDHYLIPRKDGVILAGSTLEYAGYNKSTTDAARQALWQKSVHLMPNLEKATITHHWAGLRPRADNNLPCVGPHPDIDGFFMNFGHFRYGILMAPRCAELISQSILENG